MRKKSIIKGAIVAIVFAVAFAAAFVLKKGLVSEASDVKTDDNKIVIYYSTGYDKTENANIHYKVGNGEWTQEPGVAMEKNTELNGYFFTYTIELGEEKDATVCFNDGTDWDNNDNKDYKLTAGTYGISYGEVVTFDNESEGLSVIGLIPEKADKYINHKTSKLLLEAYAVGGTTDYSYQYCAQLAGEDEKIIRDYSSDYSCNWKPDKNGIYKLRVNVKDADGNVATKSIENYSVEDMYIEAIKSDFVSPQPVNTMITLYMKAYGETDYKNSTVDISIINDSTKQVTNCIASYDPRIDARTIEWTPTEAGEYTINFKVTDIYKTVRYLSSKYTIMQDDESFAKIYYKADDMGYIHYQLGDGSWTKEHGVMMQEVKHICNGYKYVYSVYLGDASNITCCFNNGSDKWDSRYGANYSFGKGTYYVADYQIKTTP